MWGFFHDILQSCLDTYVPLKRIHNKFFKQPTLWLTPQILSAITAKHKAKCTAECACNPADVDYYKSIKNSLKTMIRTAKLDYIKSLLLHFRRSPKFAATLWSKVNEIIGRRQSCRSSLSSDLSLESINDFFRTVAVTNDHRPAASYSPPAPSSHSNVFKFQPIQSSEVLSALRGLDTKKSAGPDGISFSTLSAGSC